MEIEITKEGWAVIGGDTHVAAWIKESGKLDHDDHLIPLACLNIPVGGVAIDCGSLYGDHAYGYSKRLGSEGTCIAIEANKLAYDCLVQNAKRFECPTICIHAVLSDEHGGTALHQILDGNVGTCSVTSDEKTGVRVRTISLDGLCKDASLTRCDFIKLDIEGYELRALQGARGLLKQFSPKMLIEVNDYALAQQGDSVKGLLDFLIENGYAFQIVQPQCKGGDPIYDILAWKNPIQEPDKTLIV